MSSVVWTVARREIVERVRQRAFLISTAVTLLIVAAAAIVPGVLGNDGPKHYAVAVVGNGSAQVGAAAKASAPAAGIRILVAPVGSIRAAEGQLRDGKVDAAVLDGRRLVSKDELSGDLRRALQAASTQVRGIQALRDRGISPRAVREATSSPPLPVRTLENDNHRDERRGVAFAVTLLLYFQLLTYGLWVAFGVVEEKSSRVVEILLSTIRPRQLLTGKIIGLGLLSFAQLMLTVIVGAGLARASGVLDVSGQALGTVGVVLLWFPLGYALYACLYAAAGALVSRQEDVQATTTPLTLLIVAGYLVSFKALDDPDGTVARVASIIPFFAPLLMPIRMALGDASAIEVIVSLVLLIVSIGLVVRLAARVYQRAILRMGKPVSWRSALGSS